MSERARGNSKCIAPAVSNSLTLGRTGTGHLYHLVILGWLQLLTLFVALYILVVGFFAFMFAACNGCVRTERSRCVSMSGDESTSV